MNTLVATAIGALFATLPISTGVASCSRDILQAFGSCAAVSDDGTSLDVTIEKTADRKRPATPRASTTDPSSSPSRKPFDFSSCLTTWNDARTCYRATPTTTPTPNTPTPDTTPGITLTDLAHLAPDPTPITTEPAAAGVARLPMNFTTSADVHTQTATLLGTPLTVRFTPVAYIYDYGDNTTATHTTPAHTWAQLHQDPHTPTPTSHTYTSSGTYTARLAIRYTAEIDAGTGWSTVPGLLTVESPPVEITVYDAHLALVAHTCTEQPTAPGC